MLLPTIRKPIEVFVQGWLGCGQDTEGLGMTEIATTSIRKRISSIALKYLHYFEHIWWITLSLTDNCWCIRNDSLLCAHLAARPVPCATYYKVFCSGVFLELR